ncbi:MAG TPA: hypothetical protein VFZ68_18625 [Acidimicrobiales bacterium]
MSLSDPSRVLAGILLLSLATVETGGVLLLRILRGRHPATPLQQSFFRAGHAHAGVFLTLGLIAQVLVDATDLTGFAEWLGRAGIPVAALLIPGGFFLSVTGREVTEPNRLFWLIPAGAVVLAAGVITLGIGLIVA